MNDSVQTEPLHRAYLCLGSNIQPEQNIRAAIRLLRERARVTEVSTCWETEAVRGAATPASAPNFLNIAIRIETPLLPPALKAQLLDPIERELGRVRTADKYASRTIDLDITLFDEQVLDPELWRRVYLATIFSELLPDLRHPSSGELLGEIARRLRETSPAVPHPEIL